MARLVTKFKYLKHAGRYAKYIATREGVEKLDDSRVALYFAYLPACLRYLNFVTSRAILTPSANGRHPHRDVYKRQALYSGAMTCRRYRSFPQR